MNKVLFLIIGICLIIFVTGLAVMIYSHSNRLKENELRKNPSGAVPNEGTQNAYVNITITNLDNTYKVGQKIFFTADVKAYCKCEADVPFFTIKDYEHNQVWRGGDGVALPIGGNEMRKAHFTYPSIYYNSLQYPIINQTGSYTLIASFANKTVEKGFMVVP